MSCLVYGKSRGTIVDIVLRRQLPGQNGSPVRISSVSDKAYSCLFVGFQMLSDYFFVCSVFMTFYSFPVINSVHKYMSMTFSKHFLSSPADCVCYSLFLKKFSDLCLTGIY